MGTNANSIRAANSDIEFNTDTTADTPQTKKRKLIKKHLKPRGSRMRGKRNHASRLDPGTGS